MSGTGSESSAANMRDIAVRVAQVLLLAVVDHLRHPREVGAGAEHRPRAREHDRAHGPPAVRRVGRRRPRRQLGDDLFVERVAHLGAVEREVFDRAVAFRREEL